MTDKVRLEGILEEGYGLSPKLVMRDKGLTIEAKAIYAYMSSFAGNGEKAFPKVSTVCKDLQISRQRFNRHRQLLIEKGYISIEKRRSEGKFDNNIYILNSTVVTKHHHGKTPPWQNVTTNNNKDLNNNSFINSSSNAFAFYEQNFGVISPFLLNKINKWIDDLSEELVIESMKIALTNNKQFNYAEGILRDWYKRNIRTIDDVAAARKEFERKRNPATRKREVADFEID